MSAQNADCARLTVGSLFSGIGGIDLGLERAGMRVIWQSEIDPYASKVLAKHWPTVPNLGDVREIDWSTVERPDVVAGGFPCQPVSRIGGKRGQADDKWLWPEFARCLRYLRPDYVIVENVPNLLGIDGGRAAQEVFGDLAQLGFDAEWGVLPASAFGAPHTRKRAFIVAYAQGRAGGENGSSVPGHGFWNVARPTEERRTRRSGGGSSEAESGRGWWAVEPDLGRVAYGVPAQVDRIRCLGNAVVPQVAAWVGRQVLAAHNAHSPSPIRPEHNDGSRCNEGGGSVGT